MRTSGDITMKKARLTELDIARGVAVLGMVLVHVYLYLCSSDNRLFYYICTIPGTPFAAPVFLFLLGGNIVLAGHDNVEYLFRRGLKMALITVLYTTLGYVFPHLLSYFMTGNAVRLYESVDFLLSVDLLQLSTLTFFFFALCKKLHVHDFVVLLFAVSIAICRQIFFSDINPSELSLRLWLARLFVGTQEKAWFPFACWILFPVAGNLFFRQMAATTNRRRFYLISLCISGFIFIISYLFLHILGWPSPLQSFDGYYRMNILGNAFLISFVIAWISFCYLILPYIPGTLIKILTSLSRNTTIIYCVHFPIIMYIYVLAFNKIPCLGIIETILLTVFLLIFGTLCAALLKRIQNHWPTAKNRIP